MNADTPSFSVYATLQGDPDKTQLALQFAELGWDIRKASWDGYELRCNAAELILEAQSPCLLHGSLGEDAQVIAIILKILESTGQPCQAEVYDDLTDALIAQHSRPTPT